MSKIPKNFKIPKTFEELERYRNIEGFSIVDAGLLAETMFQTLQVFNDYDTCNDVEEWDAAVMLLESHIENLGMGPAALMLAKFHFEGLRIVCRERILKKGK